MCEPLGAVLAAHFVFKVGVVGGEVLELLQGELVGSFFSKAVVLVGVAGVRGASFGRDDPIV